MQCHAFVAVSLVLKTSLFVLSLLHLIRDIHADEITDYHARLLQDMFDNHRIDPRKRPVVNFKDVVSVDLFLAFLHIYKMDENTGTLYANGWAEISWHDPQLKWNPVNYNNIGFVPVPDTSVWKPDLTILNPEDASSTFEYNKVLVYVYSDGWVSWWPPFRTRTSCPIDHRYFPYDEHTCKVQLGSWSYSSTELVPNIPYDKHPENTFIQRFAVENPQWVIASQTGTIVNVTTDCCPDLIFQHVEYTLRLQRRSPLYKFIFVAPSIMTMLLTLALFWLPTNSSEKLTVGGIAVFVQVALLLVLSITIPPGGLHIPHIVLFCGNALVMTSLSLIVTVVVLRFSRSHSYTPLPSVVKNFLSGFFGRMLCLGLHAGMQVDTNSLTESKKDLETVEENRESTIPSYPEKPSCFNDWMLLATAIDHICFVAYCVIFAIIIVGSFVA